MARTWVTDGGFRPDGTFVHMPLHDVATLTEAFRRAVLKKIVNRELMDIETAQGMLKWPHSGFHTPDDVKLTTEVVKHHIVVVKHTFPAVSCPAPPCQPTSLSQNSVDLSKERRRRGPDV